MRWSSSICLSFSASGKAILRRLHFIEKLAPQPLSLGFVPENRFGQLVWDFRREPDVGHLRMREMFSSIRVRVSSQLNPGRPP